MITDGQLYQLAIFFGVAAMLLILVYHFLEVNAPENTATSGKEGASKRTLRKIEPRIHNKELGLNMTRSGAV
ncbi:hypothetical protein HYE68_010630 [Fusarium pseudograminearum]|nr:hypothetical protein HYE68_010630 [Fusarium pseudograminearum]